MSTTKFKEEVAADLIDEIKPLIEDHYKEVALYQDNIPLKPDFDKYVELNENGMLRIFTARREGKLIGYFLVVVMPHLHYKENVFAMNDIIYVEPSKRGGMVAYRLIKYVEKVLKDEGVSVLMINMKTSNMFSRLLEGLGFTNTELVYTKYIGG